MSSKSTICKTAGDLKKFLSSKVLLKENMDKEDKLAHKWDNLLEDEMKWELLCSAVPPRKAEELIQLKWNDIPEEVQSNIDWSLESEGQELDEVDKGGVNPDITKMKALLVKLAKFVQNWEKEEPNSFKRMMDIDLAIELEKYL